jgi:hypothetical protein
MSTRRIGKRNRAQRTLLPLFEIGAYNVIGFCLAHGLSRRTFYTLRQAGEGPRIMKCGRRTLVSIEAARAWRHRCERAAVSRVRHGRGRPDRRRAKARVRSGR